MDYRRKTIAALNRNVQALERASLELQMQAANLDSSVRVAASIPKPMNTKVPDTEVAGQVKRAIPSNYQYDAKALKPLAKMLWALSISLGHALTAHRQFTKLKSATISPDGMLGGRGYVMSVKDVRKTLYDACEAISAISDTIHDEINAPHWRPRLAELEKQDLESVERLVGDAERILDDPEADIDEEMGEAETEGNRAEMEEHEVGSQMPGAGDIPEGVSDPVGDMQTKMASAVARRFLQANSSLPVETLPGPRVQHLDRGDQDQTGPGGSYNRDESPTSDPWGTSDGVDHEYDYQSEWDNNLMGKSATSTIPDATTDKTPTEADDFGIGYGEGNDAHGQGSGGYGTVDSDGRGVYGPSSQMPTDPGGKTKDRENSDSTPVVERSVGSRATPKNAWKIDSTSEMPVDVQRSVARADYYQGDKGDNMFNSISSDVGTSEMPGEPEVDYEYDKDVQPGVGYRYEQGYQPYVKWDSDTHNMRPDFIYQREVEGPYVKQEG